MKNKTHYLHAGLLTTLQRIAVPALVSLLSVQSYGLCAQQATVSGPDNNLKVDINVNAGKPVYTIMYKDKVILEESPIGFDSNIGNFSNNISYVSKKEETVEKNYKQDRIKHSDVNYKANKLTVTLENGEKKKFDVVFMVSDNDVAFRYEIPKDGDTGSIIINSESTGFNFPSFTTTFLTPQSDPMIGWKRTKPSYEEIYLPDAPLTQASQFGKGYTFPALFHIGENGWALVSETGVDSRYCASRLSDASDDGVFTVAFPMPEENNGNGTAAPGMALPGNTPWRTITVGDNLKPVVETTIPWDVVEPLYVTNNNYKHGKSTWSWILWQDGSINYDDQVKFIDLSSEMGYQYALVDNWWDTNIGHERMEDLIKYGKSKNVDLFIWYSSSGYWNDIVQGPINVMDNPISRKKEMKWLQKNGVKGIKVDFFGGDKQETMRLYESILSDADDHGLMVIFHGCTIPRGWERMYPNFVGSEAVLASENLIFTQESNDNEAYNACLHPFIRNSIGSMDFGGVLLNKRHDRTNSKGNIRRTTDAFQLATATLFQSPVQNFAITPNNLTDAPSEAIEYMKTVPTEWDETVFIDGYPGKFVVLARRNGDDWYITGVNAQKEPLKLKLNLPMLNKGDDVKYYTDNKKRELTVENLKIKRDGELTVTMQPDGGMMIIK